MIYCGLLVGVFSDGGALGSDVSTLFESEGTASLG